MSAYTDFNDFAVLAIDSLQESLNKLGEIQQFPSPDIYDLSTATDLILAALGLANKAKKLVHRIAIKQHDAMSNIMQPWRVSGKMKDSDDFSIVTFARDEEGAIKDIEEGLKRNWNIEPTWIEGPFVRPEKMVSEQEVIERNKAEMSARQLEEFYKSYPSERP